MWQKCPKVQKMFLKCGKKCLKWHWYFIKNNTTGTDTYTFSKITRELGKVPTAKNIKKGGAQNGGALKSISIENGESVDEWNLYI